MTEHETWQAIPDWPDYAVSNLGRVKRITTYGRGKAGTIRKTALVAGYPSVSLTHRSGRRKLLHVHRLVAVAFLGDPPSPDMEVNHKDSDRQNPRADNLEWVTRSENRKHGYTAGFACAKGESNGYSKLTEDGVRMIRTDAKRDRSNWAELAERFGVSVGTVRDVFYRRTWKHVAPSSRAA